MQNDIYPRFLKSTDYQEMLRKGKEMNSVGKGFFSKLKYSNLGGVKKTKFEILSMDDKGVSPCLPQRYARRHVSHDDESCGSRCVGVHVIVIAI